MDASVVWLLILILRKLKVINMFALTIEDYDGFAERNKNPEPNHVRKQQHQL